MNWDEARALAERVREWWPTTRIKPGVWVEAFTDCEHGAAYAVLRRLRDTREQPPAVATFKLAYKALVVPDAETAPIDCPWCEGTGSTPFVRLPRLDMTTGQLDPGQLATIVRHGHAYEVVLECDHCPAAAHRKAVS